MTGNFRNKCWWTRVFTHRYPLSPLESTSANALAASHITTSTNEASHVTMTSDKAQNTSNDVFWAIGMFFLCSYFIAILTNYVLGWMMSAERQYSHVMMSDDAPCFGPAPLILPPAPPVLPPHHPFSPPPPLFHQRFNHHRHPFKFYHRHCPFWHHHHTQTTTNGGDDNGQWMAGEWTCRGTGMPKHVVWCVLGCRYVFFFNFYMITYTNYFLGISWP